MTDGLAMYKPFFATAGLFLIMLTGAVSYVRDLEREIDLLRIRQAVFEEKALDAEKRNRSNYDRHISLHRREREEIDLIWQFLRAEAGVKIRIDPEN